MFRAPIRRIPLLVASALAIAACNAKERSSADIASTAHAAPMRVALLTSGTISDQGWNSGAYSGLLALHDSMGAQISNIETKTPAEYDENFRQYGAQGYTLVFGNGFEYQDAAVRIAPQFPKTVYIVTSGRVVAPNIAGVGFAFDQPSYQAGMLAGTMTKSNVIGMIAGQEIPPVKAAFVAFERGVKAVNPKVRVLTAYIGNWDDVSAGKELALSQIGKGVDVIFQNADAAGLGVFQAAREKKILALGANANQNHIAPDVIVASVVIDFPKIMLEIAREVQNGTFKGRVIYMDVASNVVRLEINPAFSARIPRTITDAIDSVGKSIKAGTFHTLDDLLAGADTAVKAKP